MEAMQGSIEVQRDLFSLNGPCPKNQVYTLDLVGFFHDSFFMIRILYACEYEWPQTILV